MAVKWTDEQKDAIETTDKGVIVSAAAGSGKTAVLIERTIRLLCDEEKNIPADKLLAVTFTKDATNQMKTKFAQAIEKKLEETPDNLWIQKQQDNLNLAKINTINAFCFDIVKDNIHEFEFQSGLKILEDIDAEVIFGKAVDDAFEYFYENKPEMMGYLVDRLTDNNEKALKDIVKDVYYFLRSQPFPEQWCSKVLDNLRSENGTDMYVDILRDKYAHTINRARKNHEYLQYFVTKLKVCNDRHRDMFDEDGLVLYKNAKLIESGEWDDIYDAFVKTDFGKGNILLKASVDDDDYFNQQAYIDTIKELRSKYKALVKNITTELGKIGRHIERDLKETADIFEHLVELCNKTEEYAWEEKLERNSVTFSDVEIMTIQLLIENTDEGLKRTKLAEEMVKNQEYKVILIDEFQDVNNLQELIFKAISDTDDLNIMGSNVFVVGDVKQSIYRFRQSNPLLFINAKEVAEDEDIHSVKSVKLQKNFRSRKNILDFVNYTFSLLMSKQVGEIEYNEEEMLRLGAGYMGEDYDTEIMIVKEDYGQEKPEYINFEREHYCIALKIREMIDKGYPVADEGGTRPCRASDFCVLSRGKKAGTQMAKALEAVGLKAFAEETAGYLRSREISVMINLLKVIDNPMQDMALVSVMLSTVLGFDADETGKLRTYCRDESGAYSKRLYQIMNSVAGEDGIDLGDKALEEKCKKAVECIKRLRYYSSGMSLEHLIRKIYDETDFFAVASTYENSKQKRANLRLLLEYATAYEKNSDGGVAGFIRYLDSAMKYDDKFKQAVTVLQGGESVEVKTIHKSKGLEYPFVFLCNLSKRFNTDDENKRIILNERLGASVKFSKHRELSVTEPVNYMAMKKNHRDETLSEELRLLYVAMTRAKEKLFIVLNLTHGFYNEYKFISHIATDIALAGGINANLVSECTSFAQWLYMVLLCLPGNEQLLEEAEVNVELPEHKIDSEVTFSFYSNLKLEDAVRPVFMPQMPSSQLVDELVERYSFEYVSDEVEKPAKMTVTEIVRDEKEKAYGDKNPEFYPQLPRLAEEIGKLTSAEKGTYTHLFMELANYENASKDVETELKRLHEQGFMSEKTMSGVYVQAVEKFFAGDLYKRMAKSSEVMREKHFLVAFEDLNLSEKYDYLVSSEGMLQGIADCIFREDDGYVLVDYKTDNFRDKSELLTYQTQLELYKAALDLILDTPVKSCYIYSFKLCEGVEIPLG